MGERLLEQKTKTNHCNTCQIRTDQIVTLHQDPWKENLTCPLCNNEKTITWITKTEFGKVLKTDLVGKERLLMVEVPGRFSILRLRSHWEGKFKVDRSILCKIPIDGLKSVVDAFNLYHWHLEKIKEEAQEIKIDLR